MQEWYELWSKSGANPNFRVENTSQYIAGFNWVSRWFDQYFFNKVSDLLGGIIAILIIYYFTFKSKNKEFLLENKKSTLVLLFIIFIISLIWFLKFPQLRYGGYAIAANIIFLPFCIYIINFSIDKKIIFKAKVIVILSLLIFISRNIDRIFYEIKFYEYRPIKSAFYKIENPEYKTIYSSDGVKLNITKGACWSIPQPCLRKEKIKAYKNKIYITYSKN